MRADAQRNRDHLLAVAGPVVAEQGIDVSMRDIARRADVGLATLLRHFPTREALLEGLLHASFGDLTSRASELEAAHAAGTLSSHGCATASPGQPSTAG